MIITDYSLSTDLTIYVGCKGSYETPTNESQKPEHNRDNFLVAKNDKIRVKIYKYVNSFLRTICISKIKISTAFEEVARAFNSDIKIKSASYLLPHLPSYTEIHCTQINDGNYFSTQFQRLEKNFNKKIHDLVIRIGKYFEEHDIFFKACLCRFLQNQEIITNIYKPLWINYLFISEGIRRRGGLEFAYPEILMTNELNDNVFKSVTHKSKIKVFERPKKMEYLHESLSENSSEKSCDVSDSFSDSKENKTAFDELCALMEENPNNNDNDFIQKLAQKWIEYRNIV